MTCNNRCALIMNGGLDFVFNQIGSCVCENLSKGVNQFARMHAAHYRAP